MSRLKSSSRVYANSLGFKLTSFQISFLPRVKINSINWPAPNVQVIIAQLVEHYSANAEAMRSNPAKAPIFFFGLNFATA